MADEASIELEGFGKCKRRYSKFSYSKKEELQKPPKRSKLNPSQPFQMVLALPRSVKLKLSFKKKLKFEFYPSNKEGNNLYQHFNRSATFEIIHPYKFIKMLKFLCYKVQLIIQNIINMINYNHLLMAFTHCLVVQDDQ